MPRTVLRGDRAERHTGPRMAIIGTFRDDHSGTLHTVGSGPAPQLTAVIGPRKAQSENQSE